MTSILALMRLKAQEKINLPGFIASSRWIRKFKRLLYPEK